MDVKNLLEAIMELSNEKDIDRDVVIQALEETIAQAARRKYPNFDSIDAVFQPEDGVIGLFQYKMVVGHMTDPDNEISYEDAKQIDEDSELGDELEYEIELDDYQTVIAQTARHYLFQRIREIEKENIFKKYKDKVMQIVHGTIGRVDKTQVTILLDSKVEALLDRREQIPGEKFQPRDHVRALLLKIGEEGKNPKLFLSRTHPIYLKRLLESEIPEVFDGTISISNVTREPGKRAKVSVRSSDSDIDPVGSCVGQGGSRIQPIVSELCDEKIDIIDMSDDIMTYITRALAPAQISSITVNTEERTAEVEVDNDQLSLAIGRQGQNVRLASKLTNYRINVFSGSNQAEDINDMDLEEIYEQTKNVAESEAVVTESVSDESEVAVAEPESVEEAKEN